MQKKFLSLPLIIAGLICGSLDKVQAADIFDCTGAKIINPKPTGWVEAEVGYNVGFPTRSNKSYKFLASTDLKAPPLPSGSPYTLIKPVPQHCNLARFYAFHIKHVAVLPSDAAAVQ